ncbi:MAG: GNAT family N-acetyltransferase [Sphingomonas hengshuiensis]|nr:MAG: GNAT family N-acetyltransferase [Sphingomonas hengshuiensis]
MKPFLYSNQVGLVPLDRSYRDELLLAASDGKLWESKVTTVPDSKTINDYINIALIGKDDGSSIPFVITINGKVVGSTRFWKLDLKNKNVEIGHTWIAMSWQGSSVNIQTKYLMLQYAFEQLALIRVQFTTDELNTRSRRAIIKIGAVEEGLIRNERIMPDGRKRNSMRYSIIDTEWPAVKERLECKLQILPAL